MPPAESPSGGEDQWSDAISAYQRAVALEPGNAVFHANMGEIFLHQGCLEQAAACFRRAISLKHVFPEAHDSLGVVLQRQDLPSEAIACHTIAVTLRPNFARAMLNLGAAWKATGNLDQALVAYSKVAKLAPDLAEAWNNRGVVLYEMALSGQDRWEEAIGSYERAIALEPENGQFHHNLGIIFRLRGRLDEAAASFRRAVAFQPDFPVAHDNLGVVLQKQNRLGEAIQCHTTALRLKPDFVGAMLNLGAALGDTGEIEESLGVYVIALQLAPDSADGWHNLGVALQRLGRSKDALPCIRRAVALNPRHPGIRYGLAETLLTQGEMAEGWAEYEWRWLGSVAAGRRPFAQPQWRGEAAEGRTLLLHAEQGFGDTLQFCRYAPLAAARGLRVILEVPAPLLRLLGSMAGVERLIRQGDDLPPFDLHCPMLSMPLALATTVETIPASVPYLHADPARAEMWRTRLAPLSPGHLKVGLVWAGNPRLFSPVPAATDRRRSLAPGKLMALAGIPGVRLFSLQKFGRNDNDGLPLVDFMDEMDDFADTAALIQNLDLVISVDTAVLHLAAALGKPVWMLDRFDHCWRWLAGRNDSPWYPTLKIYRQPRPGDWDPVMTDVARDLQRLSDANATEGRGLLREELAFQ